ncbi:MAG: cell division protein FtsQ/DivIB [Candidatus Omnitrophica bacterium]|nr:cell division protein FtsQ/DivIB [Candidatus Omnitrophota bacterium]
MKNKKNVFYFRILVIGIFIFIGVFILNKILRFVFASEYFNIKYIITSQRDIQLDYLKGRNIFSLDLKAIFERLTADYPQYKIVRISIQPPNNLVVKSERRIPLAYVRLYRDFVIDSEGVLFYPLEFIPDLPVIYGLESKVGYVKSGQKIKINQLNLALQLIQSFKQIEQIRRYKLRRINLESFGLTFYMDNIEVKVGDNIQEGLKLLIAILPRLDLVKVDYIDLRFKEPTVKYEK